MLVAIAATAASGVVVAGVLATRNHVPATPKPRPGVPRLSLDFGVRDDAETQALQQAESLYNSGKLGEAAKAFARDRSLEGRVGAAMAAWPHGTVAALQDLQAEHPKSSLVALHFGLALYYLHRDGDAASAWQAAASDQPDTPYAVRANDLLHPQFAPGLPAFVPSFPVPLQARVQSPQRRLASLRRAAAVGGAHAKLLYGAYLQQLERPVSAERQFAAAARLAPNDPDARTAAAVGLFDKGAPAKAFGNLGPLTRVFPHAQTVRFHLGELLLWSAQVKEARRQLQLAEQGGANTIIGVQAKRFLDALDRAGTS